MLGLPFLCAGLARLRGSDPPTAKEARLLNELESNLELLLSSAPHKASPVPPDAAAGRDHSSQTASPRLSAPRPPGTVPLTGRPSQTLPLFPFPRL